jgi:hypothetical protein
MRVTWVEGITGFRGVSRRVFVFVAFRRLGRVFRVVRSDHAHLETAAHSRQNGIRAAFRPEARTASEFDSGRAAPGGRAFGDVPVDMRIQAVSAWLMVATAAAAAAAGPAGAIAATAAANASAGTANFFAGAAGALRACSEDSTARAGVARELISMRSSAVAATFRENPRVATAPGIARTATRPREAATGRAVARAIPREADFDFSAATRTSPTVRASAKVQAISMRGRSQPEVCDASDSGEDRIGRRSCARAYV